MDEINSDVSKRFYSGFFLFLLIFSLPISAWCQDFTATISQNIFNHHLVGKIFVSDDFYRLSLKPFDSVQKSDLTVIVDLQKGKTYVKHLQSEKYEAFENFSFQAYAVDPFQTIKTIEKTALPKMVGEEIIAGFLCRRYAYCDKDFRLADVWYATGLDNFPVKANIISGRKDDSINIKTNIGDTNIELSNIREGTIDKTHFDIPRGFVNAVGLAASQKEEDVAKPAIRETVKGTAPWARRIGKGGEIQVQVDSRRPIRITLKNLDTNESAVCTYATFVKGNLESPSTSKQVTITKEWPREQKIAIDKNKNTEWLFIRVDEGLIYAKIIYEKDPFVSAGEEKILDGYLTVNEGQGFAVDPTRKLTIALTGDSQDSPESEVTIVCYRDEYNDKAFEKTVRIENGKTETWDFSTDQQIKTCEVSVEKIGGVKYRAEQPSPVKPESKSDVLTKEQYEELLRAFRSGDAAFVQKCLDSGMDPNAIAMGDPLLLRAAQFGNAEVVKLIIGRGGDIHYKDARGSDALMKAQNNMKNFQEVIPALVEAGVEVKPNTSLAILANKVKSGKFMPGVRETIEYLISKGANINAPITNDGRSPLLVAAEKAWLEPVQFYLDRGADINAQDEKGNTALSLVKVERHNEMPYLKENRKAIIELLEYRGAR